MRSAPRRSRCRRTPTADPPATGRRAAIPAQPPTLTPFDGNVEIEDRLDTASRLVVAGERLHEHLVRRFYEAHGYADGLGPPSGGRRRVVGRGAARRRARARPGLVPQRRTRRARRSNYRRSSTTSCAVRRGARLCRRAGAGRDAGRGAPRRRRSPAAAGRCRRGDRCRDHRTRSGEERSRRSPRHRRNTWRCAAPMRAYLALAASAGRIRRRRAASPADADRRRRAPCGGRVRSRSISSGCAGCRAIMPADRLVVNTAIAQLQLFRDDRPVFTTRVVIGEFDKQTPELQSIIQSVLFNPPWNIPRSIVRKGDPAEAGGRPPLSGRASHAMSRADGGAAGGGPIQRSRAAQIRDGRPFRRLSARHAGEMALSVPPTG